MVETGERPGAGKVLASFGMTVWLSLLVKPVEEHLPVPIEVILGLGLAPLGFFLTVHWLDFRETRRRIAERRYAPDAPLPRWGFLSTALPALLTVVRPGLGVGIALLYVDGAFAAALALYLAAQVTDVLDGMVARALGGTSGFGRELDQYADAVFHLAAGGGVAYHALTRSEWGVLAALVALVVITAVAQIVSGAHTALAKDISGLVRVAMFVVLVIKVPGVARWVLLGCGAALLALAGSYEALVTQREVAAGERTSGLKVRQGLSGMVARFFGRARRLV